MHIPACLCSLFQNAVVVRLQAFIGHTVLNREVEYRNERQNWNTALRQKWKTCIKRLAWLLLKAWTKVQTRHLKTNCTCHSGEKKVPAGWLPECGRGIPLTVTWLTLEQKPATGPDQINRPVTFVPCVSLGALFCQGHLAACVFLPAPFPVATVEQTKSVCSKTQSCLSATLAPL